MAPKHTVKAWDDDDRKLMSFYGMDLDHPEVGLPKFGSDIRVEELSDARLGTFQKTFGGVGGYSFFKRRKHILETSTRPTILNLAGYFRYIESGGGLEMLRTVAEQYPGPTADFTRLLLNAGENAFFNEHVGPLREYLEWKCQIYFYCIPATSYERQLVGGRGFQSDGPSILCLLPKFPQVALDRGEGDARLKQVAGQMLWLVHSKLCVNCKTEESRQDLIGVVSAWKNYVTTYYLLDELDKMERNNPFFITEQVREALLPASALDLLRLPAA